MSKLGEISLIMFSDKNFDKLLGKYTVKVLHTSILGSTSFGSIWIYLWKQGFFVVVIFFLTSSFTLKCWSILRDTFSLLPGISVISIGGATVAAAPGPRRRQGPMKEGKKKEKKQLSRIDTGTIFVNEIFGGGREANIQSICF